ncbi:MAG: hypothetical protein FNNCIFGK_00618 [Bacteroidia bacterium]|nr:hypothetical protein [Bacteroidia bacterium]
MATEVSVEVSPFFKSHCNETAPGAAALSTTEKGVHPESDEAVITGTGLLKTVIELLSVFVPVHPEADVEVTVTV